MTADHYRSIIKDGSHHEIGVAMGKAIKDNMINPETYAMLCRESKAVGFKFRWIVFDS